MMIERISDVEYIKSCVTHPKLWKFLSDDGSGEPEKYVPPVSNSVYWLSPMEEGQRYGVFFLHPHNFVCYEVHTCLLPMIWGRTRECTKAAIDWVFNNTPCQRIITNVPDYNILALRLAEDSGMVQFGINKKSYQKKGKLFDQIMLGINKEDYKCQQQFL